MSILSAHRRAALVTGRYVNSAAWVCTPLGTQHHFMLRRKTIADHYLAAGYKTCMVGKWHLGDNAPYRPEDRALRMSSVLAEAELDRPMDYWKNNLWCHYWNNGDWVKNQGFVRMYNVIFAIDFVDKNQNSPFFIFIYYCPHSLPVPTSILNPTKNSVSTRVYALSRHGHKYRW